MSFSCLVVVLVCFSSERLPPNSSLDLKEKTPTLSGWRFALWNVVLAPVIIVLLTSFFSRFSNLHSTPFLATRGGLLAKPNYQFEKRQRDLAKKAKQEEKRRQKLAEKAGNASGEDAALSPSAADVAPSDAGTPKA